MAERGPRANEKAKGVLEPRKLADLVILENYPLQVPSDTIGGIAVLETIKEGRRSGAAASPEAGPPEQRQAEGTWRGAYASTGKTPGGASSALLPPALNAAQNDQTLACCRRRSIIPSTPSASARPLPIPAGSISGTTPCTTTKSYPITSNARTSRALTIPSSP